MTTASSSGSKSLSGSIDTAVSSATLHAQFRGNGLSEGKAATYAAYLQHMSDDIQKDLHVQAVFQAICRYIQKHPDVWAALKGAKDGHDVYKGARQAITAARYTGDLNARIQDYGRGGAAGVLGVFVDKFGALAKDQGIKLDECWFSVAKVATDIGGVGVGSLASVNPLVSPLGFLLIGVSAVATFRDSQSLGKACFNPVDSSR